MPSNLNSKRTLSNSLHLSSPLLFSAALLLLLSLCAWVSNALFSHYPGNNYLPSEAILIASVLILTYLGCSLQYGKSAHPTLIIQELLIYFTVMVIIALATNAAQFTPFETIDKEIIAFESQLQLDLTSWMSTVQTMPKLKTLLEFAYNNLSYQMIWMPLIPIILQETERLREYYLLLFISTLIGFSFYYFFPTTAPASMLSSPYFDTSQFATGLKFNQLHHHIAPTTMEGGLIALPSFHTIWAWFCCYMLRGRPVFMILFMPLTLLVISSCVLLGWHYLTDILGSFIVILLSHGISHALNLTFPTDSTIVSKMNTTTSKS